MKPLWVSLSTYGGVTTGEALQVLWAAGVRHIELAIGVKPSPDTTATLRHYQQQGMHYRAHHALVWEEVRPKAAKLPFNLANSFDKRYFERLTDWLAAMNITAYSVHAGSFTRADDPTDAYDRFVTHLEKLRQLCGDRQIRLAVETMYPNMAAEGSQYLIQNAVQVEQLLQDLPDIDLVVDMAHLNIWKAESILQKLQLLDRFDNRLLEIHISDNDGQRDSHTTISDRTWWLPYAPLFPPDVPIVLESRMNRWSVEQVRQQVQTVQAIVNGRTQP
ncbi:MAG: TIM barrel protein [Microcoleus sp. SIO2G3]|nr:TIM barrel protein [Microcoleus sp. SIO2G3]